MQSARTWKDHAVLQFNSKRTTVVLRCDLENATIDVVAFAAENEHLFVGAAKGQASIVMWLVHLIKMFLRGYSQLQFKDSWLCPTPECHGINGRGDLPWKYAGSEFSLTPATRRKKAHDCDVEGCWRFLGKGHSLEPMRLLEDAPDVCERCGLEPIFRLRQYVD